MSIPSTNIDWPNVAIELGMDASSSQNMSVMCTSSGQSPFAYYGQGSLTTDACGTAKLYFTGPPYNWGDWRLYDQDASAPWPATNFTHNYLGTSPTDVNSP